MVVFVTGAVRSGKTRYALSRAEALGPRRVYLATAQALDDEMRDRIQRHQAERGAGWVTAEVPLAVPAALRSMEGVVLLDCLTLWLSNLYMDGRGPEAVAAATRDLAAALAETAADVVVVSNEVGWGIVPVDAMTRRYRDELGWLSQAVAAVASEVWLTVAGLPMRVK